MRTLLATVFWAVLLACAALAQTVDPYYSGTYSITNLGSVSGVPTQYGGLVFKDANTILLGGAANESGGRFYSVPVVRGAGSHVVSFGSVTQLGYGTYNDGGIAFGPGGVLFYSEYPENNVGQVKSGDNADDKTVSLSGLVASSTGALNFVPSGYNGAGNFIICSYSGGGFYTVGLSADGSGTYNLAGSTLRATLTDAGPEGFIYVPFGSPLFPSQSMIVSEYFNDEVASYTIDANGAPVPGSRRLFIGDLEGAEGAAIDPVTGDFFFSTFGEGNQVFEVRGFVPPSGAPPPSVPTLTAWGMLAATMLVLGSGLLLMRLSLN